MTADTPLNVHQRRAKVKGILAVTQFTKDQSNSQFKSVPIDSMRNEVAKAESSVGLSCTYEEEEFTIMPMGGKFYARITAIIRTYNADDPTDLIEERRTAIAWDASDKAFNKAESMIWKNHFKAIYAIAARDGEDADQYSAEEQELLERFREEKEKGKPTKRVTKRDKDEPVADHTALQEAAKADRFFGNLGASE